MENDVVLLDFCDTVAKFQTFDPYILFILKQVYPKRYAFATSYWTVKLCSLFQFFMRVARLNGYIYKNLIVFLLKGLNYQTACQLAREYYDNVVEKQLITETVDAIKKFVSDKNRIIIVSGGCGLYIKHFAEKYGINDIISTTLEFRNNICTGRISDLDCMGKNKLKMLKEYICKNNIKNDVYACLTDSCSDMPILNLAKRKIIISKNKHQNWVTSDMEEIIWN